MSNEENFKKNIEYCLENGIKKILMFIKEEENIIKLNNVLRSYENAQDIQLIGVSFPANEKMYIYNKETERTESIIPKASDGNKIKKKLADRNITLITSTLPFEGIVVPGDNFNPYKIIEKTFNIVNISLSALVQSILVATDNGVVNPGEKVLSMNLTTALYANGTNTRYLFHPKYGFKVNEILNKKRSPLK